MPVADALAVVVGRAGRFAVCMCVWRWYGVWVINRGETVRCVFVLGIVSVVGAG